MLMLNKKILIAGFVCGAIAVIGYETISNNQKHPLSEAVAPTITSTIILSGYWFTPHAAIRNITFLDNHRFEFKTGDTTTSISGTYLFDGTTLVLPLNTGQSLSLTLSHDNQGNTYLRNDMVGEYFVKQ
jgi:hypothetical protein